jgi:hypothetical protein
VAVRQDSALTGDRFKRGALARVAVRLVGRVLREQPAVAVEQGDAVGSGEAAQERRGGLGGFGVQAATQGAGRQRGGVQRGMHSTLGRRGHHTTCAHHDDRGDHRRQYQRGRQRYRELARHLTSPGTLDWSRGETAASSRSRS